MITTKYLSYLDCSAADFATDVVGPAGRRHELANTEKIGVGLGRRELEERASKWSSCA